MKRRRPQTEWEKGFEQGQLWGVARIVQLHGEDGLAYDVLAESGANPGHADYYDLPFIRQAAKGRGRAIPVRVPRKPEVKP